MRNFVQSGANLTVPAPAAVKSGDIVIVGSLQGIAARDAASGADVDIVMHGVFALPKVSALAIAIGDIVLWDTIAKLVTKTPASGTTTQLGVAVAAAANPSATVNVLI